MLLMTRMFMGNINTCFSRAVACVNRTKNPTENFVVKAKIFIAF